MDYHGQVVVVTGASSGIGWETARVLAAKGARVVAIARREDRLLELGTACRGDGGDYACFAGDLADRAFAERVIRETLAQYGRLDILVNNAAAPKHKHVFHLAAGEAEYLMRLNFLAPVWMTLAALPAMLVQEGGVIVNVSSFSARLTPPRESLYSASKAALNAFTEGLWVDLEGSNIHAAVINPGPIDTEIWDRCEEPSGYSGPKYPAVMVANAILEAIEKRRLEITVPRRNPRLLAARLLRLVAPSLLRRGMASMEPVPDSLVESARMRARESMKENRVLRG